MNSMPRYALSALAVVMTVAGLWAVVEVFKLAGWQITLGFVVGHLLAYVMFRWHYGWWPDFNIDGEDAENSLLPRIDLERQDRRTNVDGIMSALVIMAIIACGIYLVL